MSDSYSFFRLHRSSLDFHHSSLLFDLRQAATYSIEMAEQDYDPSKDPKRKPTKSPDPGWKYGFWPDLNKKDMTECFLCQKKCMEELEGWSIILPVVMQM
ncbi:unnamed protein product [Rhodiola kirilowii]